MWYLSNDYFFISWHTWYLWTIKFLIPIYRDSQKCGNYFKILQILIVLNHKWNAKQKQISRYTKSCTNTNTYHSTSLSIFMQIWGQISDSVVYLSLWTISKKKKKKSKKQLLSSKGEQQKETKGIWLRRNLINNSDNGYERSTRRSMRNDPISIAITQANYPFHRSDGRLPCKKN